MKASNSSNLALDHANESGRQVVDRYLTPLKQIDINGTELTYVEQGEGPMVVLVHGALGDFRSWSAQMAVLSSKYRVVSYSRRYHEPNSLPDGEIDYTHRRHVDDLIGLIEKLGSGPAHLVGHSYGAAVAALVAMKRPDLVSSLILEEPTLFSMLSDDLDKVSLRFHAVALNVLQKLSENGEQRLAVREYVNIVNGKDVFDELPPGDRLVINQNAHTLGPMLRTYFEPSRLDQTTGSKMTTPTLLMNGELSPRIYQAITRALHDCLPVAETFTLPGASHGLHMENREDFSVAVMGFLSKT
jgi:non-heme chloroperoxidase